MQFGWTGMFFAAEEPTVKGDLNCQAMTSTNYVKLRRQTQLSY
jgi:hypothetical protein